MSHKVLANTEYFRNGVFGVLKTKEGNVFVGHYITQNEKENDRIRHVFHLLCKENDKAKESMTIEQVIDMVNKKYHVCIKKEEVPRPKTKPYEQPYPRKIYLKITQTNSVKLHQKTREA